ncbi:MAG: phage tail assembly chaperone [Novosphingobium sp.]|nr:phage tail assembly chaperone [Novosphingobium sp.]
MSGRFGAAAARLSGQAALLLGWSGDTFWNATPEELATILAALRMPDGETVDRGMIDRLMEQDRGG